MGVTILIGRDIDRAIVAESKFVVVYVVGIDMLVHPYKNEIV